MIVSGDPPIFIANPTKLPVLFLDGKGRVLAANQASQQLIAGALQDIIGRRFWSLLPKDHRTLARKALAECMACPGAVSSMTIQQADLTVEWSLSTVRDGHEEAKIAAVGRVSETEARGPANWKEGFPGRIEEIEAELKRAVEERKRLESRLAEAEALYHGITSLDGVGIVHLDLNGKRTFVNDAFVRRHRRPAEELLRGVLADQMVSEDRDIKWKLFRQCIQTGRSVPGAVSKHINDGRTYWTKATFIPVLGRDGSPIGVQVHTVDVTDVVLSRQKAGKSEALYQGLVEATGGGVERISRDGRRLYASENTPKVVGREMGEFLAGTFGDGLVPEDRDKVRNLLAQVYATGESTKGIVSRPARGSVKYLTSNMVPIKDANGNVVEVQVTTFDGTVIMEAQERLRQSEELYRSLVESTGSMVIRVDRDGRRGFVNDYASDFTGRTIQDVMTGRFGDGIVPEDREKVWHFLNETFRTGKTFHGVMSRTIATPTRYLSSNWAPIRDRNGNVIEVQVTTFDVTELVQMQEKLRESEQVYKNLVDATGAVVVRVNRDGRRLFASRNTKDLLGRDVEDFLKGRFADGVALGYRQKMRRLLRRTFETGEPVFGFVSPSATEPHKYFSANWCPIRDSHGAVIEAQVTAFDVTQLVETREKLRLSEELYRDILELSGAAVARFDLQGRRTYASQALAELVDTTPEKLIGGKLGELNIPDDHDILWAAFHRCIATGKRATGLFTVYRKGADTHHTRSLFTPIRDSTGSVTGVQVTSVDITELVKARQQSQHAEELYRSLVEATGCIVVRVDEAGRRTFVCKRGLDLFEVNVKEGSLGLFGSTMTDEGREKAWALLKRVFKTGEVVRGFVTKQDWKGQERYVSANWEPIRDETGKVVEVQVTNFDITDIKRDQEELDRYRHRLEDLVMQRTDELQRAMRELEREMAQHGKTQDALRALSMRLVDIQELERRSIARELHDAIGQTLTALKLLLERVFGSAPDPTKALLRDARGLVQELICHVRGVSLNLRPPMLDDLGLLPTLLWYFEQYSRQTGIAVKLSHKDIERRFEPDTEITAYRILQEALNNVARHSGAKEVEVDLETSGDKLCIRVRDNGTGFDPESVLSYAGRTGLVGIRERASSLGGTVTVESAPGAGTRLTATLSLLESPAPIVSG